MCAFRHRPESKLSRTTHHRQHLEWLEALGAGFGVIAVALFTNYLATYIVAAAYGPLISLVTVLEERELVDRFGDEYRRYQRRIPGFVPSLRS